MLRQLYLIVKQNLSAILNTGKNDMSDLLQTIGINIRRYRTGRKMTQARLAEEAGVATTFITQIESAKEIPSLRTISRVADALQVEPYELLIPENISTSHHDCECVQIIEKRIRQELVDRVIAALED